MKELAVIEIKPEQAIEILTAIKDELIPHTRINY